MPTERGQYVFIVGEHAEGSPFLWAEPAANRGKSGAPTIDAFDSLGAHLGFDLRPGIDYQEAKEIAAKMNQWVASINLFYTLPPELPRDGETA